MTPRAAYSCLLVVEAVRGRGRAAGRARLRHLSGTKNGYADVLVQAALVVALDGRRVLEEVPILVARARRESVDTRPAEEILGPPAAEATKSTSGCPTR